MSREQAGYPLDRGYFASNHSLCGRAEDAKDLAGKKRVAVTRPVRASHIRWPACRQKIRFKAPDVKVGPLQSLSNAAKRP